MALATATVTADLSDMLGTDFDTRRTKVWITTNVADETVIDTVGNKIRLGSGTVTLNDDGTASMTVWVPGTGANPTSWQTSVHVDYPDPGTRTRKVRDFGPFTITASADLADLVDEQEVPPTYLSTVTALLDGYVDEAHGFATEAEAARDATIAISGLTGEDAAVGALVAGTGGAGPLTRAALSVSIAQNTRGTGFLPASLGNLLAYHDFHGPDVIVGTTDALFPTGLSGTKTASGHTIRLTHNDAGNHSQIANTYAPAPPDHVGAIMFIDHSVQYDRCAAKGHWQVPGGGATFEGSIVIGACRRFFTSSGYGGSLQLSVWEKPITDDGGATYYQWWLFEIPDPATTGGTAAFNSVVDIETGAVAKGLLADGFEFTLDGRTEFEFSMHRTARSLTGDTVVVTLPDGQILSFRSLAVNREWGPAFGLQYRRRLATDALVRFTGFSTSNVPDPSVAANRLPPLPSGRRLYLPGDGSRMTTNASAATVGVRGHEWAGTLTSWTTAQVLVSQWNGDYPGGYLQIGNDKKLRYTYTPDGVGANKVDSVSSAVVPFADGTFGQVKVTRDPVSGDVKFYTSTDPITTAVGSITWTQLGITRSTTPGPIFAGGYPLTMGGLGDGTSPVTGYVDRYRLTDDGAQVLGFNFATKPWSGYDDQANVWTFLDNGWQWILPPTGIDLSAYAPLASPALTGTPTVNGTKVPLNRAALLRPTGYNRETWERGVTTASAAGLALTSGVLTVAAIPLANGDTISALSAITGSTGTYPTTPTHLWYCLLDSAKNLVAITADQTALALSASTRYTLPIHDIASGAAASYTVPSDGLYYFGIMCVATNMPSFLCATGILSALNVTPSLSRTLDTGMTTPPAFPFTGASGSPITSWLYAQTQP